MAPESASELKFEIASAVLFNGSSSFASALFSRWVFSEVRNPGTPPHHRQSSRLRVEFLRAYLPERFKSPGTNVNIGTRGDVFVLTEEQRHELIRINTEWLLDPTTLPAERRSATEQPQRLTNGEGSALPASGEARSVRPVARPSASARTPGRSQGTLWLRTIER
jgi:hypothetical protein